MIKTNTVLSSHGSEKTKQKKTFLCKCPFTSVTYGIYCKTKDG